MSKTTLISRSPYHPYNTRTPCQDIYLPSCRWRSRGTRARRRFSTSYEDAAKRYAGSLIMSRSIERFTAAVPAGKAIAESFSIDSSTLKGASSAIQCQHAGNFDWRAFILRTHPIISSDTKKAFEAEVPASQQSHQCVPFTYSSMRRVECYPVSACINLGRRALESCTDPIISSNTEALSSTKCRPAEQSVRPSSGIQAC